MMGEVTFTHLTFHICHSVHPHWPSKVAAVHLRDTRECLPQVLHTKASIAVALEGHHTHLSKLAQMLLSGILEGPCTGGREGAHTLSIQRGPITKKPQDNYCTVVFSQIGVNK